MCFNQSIRYIIEKLFLTRSYHYSQHPDPVFFRRNVMVTDNFTTGYRPWTILIFCGAQKFLLRNAKSRDFPNRVQMVHEMNYFEQKSKKSQNVSKQNRLTTRKYFFCKIWTFWSNLLWLNPVWKLELCHKHWKKHF